VIAHRTTRIARNRKRHRHLALGAIAGVAATALLLTALSQLGAQTLPAPAVLPPLRVLRHQPAPPPPPVTPPPSGPSTTAMPLPAPSLPTLALALPQTPSVALPTPSAPSALPSLSTMNVPAAPAVASLAHRAQRLGVPDLQRYYPQSLARRGVEGRTHVRLSIDATGRVQTITVLESEPPGAFDKASRSALRQLRYRPATDASGQAVASTVEETLLWSIAR
jgi:TonB family protein